MCMHASFPVSAWVMDGKGDMYDSPVLVNVVGWGYVVIEMRIGPRYGGRSEIRCCRYGVWGVDGEMERSRMSDGAQGRMLCYR